MNDGKNPPETLEAVIIRFFSQSWLGRVLLILIALVVLSGGGLLAIFATLPEATKTDILSQVAFWRRYSEFPKRFQVTLLGDQNKQPAFIHDILNSFDQPSDKTSIIYSLLVRSDKIDSLHDASIFAVNSLEGQITRLYAFLIEGDAYRVLNRVDAPRTWQFKMPSTKESYLLLLIRLEAKRLIGEKQLRSNTIAIQKL